MSNAPTIDTPLLSGIRRVIEVRTSLTASTITRFASPRLAARSILRTLRLLAATTATRANNIQLRLAFGDTITPSATDFIGTGLLLPESGVAEAAAVYSADPATSAPDVPLNFQLPDRQGRLLFEINNGENVIIDLKIRAIVDGLGRIGGGDGSR